jgi:hypothetical protein
MIMRNKGQTAMEYLMTYGWAILIIIVVVAALYAMGVFSIKGSVSCSPCFSYFAYVDYGQSTGTVRVRNGARTITIAAADVSSIPAGASLTTDCSTAPCDPGKDIDIGSVPNTATDPNVVVTITYTDTSSALQHTDTATIHNK